MSTAANSYYFRRRTIGRAASPPTWACYEEIPYDDDDYSSSCSDDSCSEEDEDYSQQQQQHRGTSVNPPGRLEHSSDSEASVAATRDRKRQIVERVTSLTLTWIVKDTDGTGKDKDRSEMQKDVKGKQRAVDPDPEPTRGRRHRRRERQPTYTLRPILTIHRSQGFVWNQVRLLTSVSVSRFLTWIVNPGPLHSALR